MGPPKINPQHPALPPPSNIPRILEGVGLNLDHTQTTQGSMRNGAPRQILITNPRKRSIERVGSDHSEPETLPVEQERQFSLLRDSLVFNHERLLQNGPAELQQEQQQQQDYVGPVATSERASTSVHPTSLSTLLTLSSMNTNELDTSEQPTNYSTPRPKLYSVPNNPVEPSQDSDGNYDVGIVGMPRGWLENKIPRTESVKNDEIENPAQKVNLIRFTDAMTGEETCEIPLTGTAASIHLPSPPSSSIGTEIVPQKQPSLTAVTTVYSYKCERHPNRHPNQPCPQSEVGKECDNKCGIALPALVKGELVPPPSSKMSEFSSIILPGIELGRKAQENIFHGNDFSTCGEVKCKTRNMSDEGTGGDEPALLLPMDETDTAVTEIENKCQDNHLTTGIVGVGDYATDEDFDEDIGTTRGQSQPVFPNPADLKWPEPAYLRMTLPPKYHQFLAPAYKKDCRVWLWKNRKGRKAREMLAGSGSVPTPGETIRRATPVNSSTSLRNQRAALAHQTLIDATHHSTLRAFTDNDDVEEEDENNQSPIAEDNPSEPNKD